MTSSPLRRRLAPALSTVLIALIAVFGIAAPAAAHDELLGTDPAAGAALDAVPAEIVFTYSAEILPEGAEVQVTDAAGAPLTDGEPVIDGVTLTQALTGEGSGEISVLWRVVSSDGHPISGELSFTVTPAATPEETPEPTMTTMTEPEPEPSATPAETPGDDVASSADDASPLPWIIGGIIALVVVGVVIALLVARSRGNRGSGPGSDG